MKKKLEQFILAGYPDAVLDNYMETRQGIEYLFYPNADADEPYTCIVKNGKLTIQTDF